MLIFRWIVLLLLAAAVVSMAMYIGTGELRYRVLTVRIVRWTVVAGLGFFAVFVLERMAMFF